MSVEELRKQIKELNKQREKATLEKGLAAEDNKDLRENFAYDYWVEREMTITAQIVTVIKEIDKLTKKPSAKSKKPLKDKPVQRIKDLPKHKWL